jgi:hypothetical protein
VINISDDHAPHPKARALPVFFNVKEQVSTYSFFFKYKRDKVQLILLVFEYKENKVQLVLLK